MKPIKILCCFAAALLLGWGCTTTNDDKGDADGAWEGTYTNSQISLSRTDLTDTPDPPSVEFVQTDPNESKALKRIWKTSPPRIPHTIADMDPITVEENTCLECHNGEDAKKASESHFRDMRNAPAKVRTEVAGSRYNCSLCHVPQTNAKPLVANRFKE